jgi:branched-chain amino acid transport system substrate-binding protein
VLTYGIGPELAQIANGMTKLGWKVPMVGSWTLSMANYIDNAGPGGEGARMPQTFIQEPTTPKRQSFIISYLKTFNPKNARIDSPVSARRATTRSTCSPPRSSRPAAPKARRSRPRSRT